MFSKITPGVAHYRFPKYAKVFLFYSISHPIKSHVHCLGYLFLHFAAHDVITG